MRLVPYRFSATSVPVRVMLAACNDVDASRRSCDGHQDPDRQCRQAPRPTIRHPEPEDRMTPYETAGTPRPTGWRHVLTPAAGLWLLAAALTAEFGQVPVTGLPLPGGLDRAERAGLVGVAALLAWAAIGAAAAATTRLVEWACLRPDWGRAGSFVLIRRQDRWRAADDLAEDARNAARAAGDESPQHRLFHEAMARRNAIALLPPVNPGWMADRVTALQQRVTGQYGLDLPSAWPRLWLLLPASVRDDVIRARAGWDDAMLWAAWGLWFGLLGFAWWPLLPPAAVVLLWSHRRARVSLDTLAHLVESVVDVHGADLARKLGLPVDDGVLDPRTGRLIGIITRKGA
ncbi:hypothetical protein AB0B66_09190 [Catellatospora sp. NPDC049111]|uniref:hypothetical protein n=1 Tax=Catellatospora sp. NPDC049111 TaxID=3155271 RepID=UPI0033D12DDB